MAKKNDVILEETAAPAEETAMVPADAVPVDDGLVDLFVYRDPSDNNPNVVIGLNGKLWLMPKGEISRVPKAVAAEYNRAQRAQVQADRNINAMKGIKQSN